MEIYKDIDGYNGEYQVSNYGNVKSFKRGERILKPRKNHKGYCFVTLSKDGLNKNINVHRLVAMAFIPNPNNLPQINHINENKRNNRVENLEWCDARYNNNYGTGNERRGNKRCKPIVQYDADNIIIGIWKSAKAVAQQKKLHKGNIAACAKGKRNNVGGYVWRYANIIYPKYFYKVV